MRCGISLSTTIAMAPSVSMRACMHASMARAVSDSVAFSLNLVSCRRRH